MADEQPKPFADLPAALVEEMLEQTAGVGNLLLDTFRQLKADRAGFRKNLLHAGLIQKESNLDYPDLPTTCGADGSYAIERLLTADLVAAAAVVVEGLTPPSEKRHWEQPHHQTFMNEEVHHADTATVLRAVMLGMELELARKAPHDLVMIDGTLTLPIIYFNQAINQAADASNLYCSQKFNSDCCEYLEAYLNILRAERTDKSYIGLPKYSTRREIGRRMQWPGEHDDRGILTLVLDAGEYTEPVRLENPEQAWHLNTNRLPQHVRERAATLAADITNRILDVHILYYKPHDWLPALRVEMARDIATNRHRLAIVIQGLKYQCAAAAMLEPYPLYLADRMVKSLSRAMPTFRHVTTQHVADNYKGDIGDVFFAMHGYRSESGV